MAAYVSIPYKTCSMYRLGSEDYGGHLPFMAPDGSKQYETCVLLRPVREAFIFTFALDISKFAM